MHLRVHRRMARGAAVTKRRPGLWRVCLGSPLSPPVYQLPAKGIPKAGSSWRRQLSGQEDTHLSAYSSWSWVRSKKVQPVVLSKPKHALLLNGTWRITMIQRRSKSSQKRSATSGAVTLREWKALEAQTPSRSHALPSTQPLLQLHARKFELVPMPSQPWPPTPFASRGPQG